MGRRLWMVAAIAVATVACGDEDETPGTVTQAPPEQARAGAAGDEGAGGAAEEQPSAVEEPAAGPVVTDPAFELRAAAAGPFRSGELGRFSITLTPRGQWHVNQEYPIRVELDAPGEVGLPKTELERADAAEFGEERARFDVPFTPSAAGEHRVRAKVSFAVCTDENCIPDERTLALVLPVE